MAFIDKSKPIPLYYQLVEIINGQIARKELGPGDKLPTEQWFSQNYDISRVTVRKALEELIQSGAIERIRGKGPVVASPKLNRKLSRLTGLHEEITESGYQSTSLIFDIEYKQAEGAIARHLHTADGEPVVTFRRLRCLDEVPFADQMIYLRTKFCENFDPKELETSSLYQILENRYHLRIDYADQTLGIKTPTKKQLEDLHLTSPTPLLRMRRTTYLNTGEVVEYTEISYVPDRYELSMRLYR